MALERAEACRADESFASVEEAVDARIVAGGIDRAPRHLLLEEFGRHLEAGPDGRLRYRYSRTSVATAYSELAKTPPLEPLTVPTLLLHGAETDVVPPVLVEFCVETYGKHLEVVTVSGGHMPLWDAFDETADAIAAFLTEGPAARS